MPCNTSRRYSVLLIISFLGVVSHAFLPLRHRANHRKKLQRLDDQNNAAVSVTSIGSNDKQDAALDEAIRLMTGGDSGDDQQPEEIQEVETPNQVHDRIQRLVKEHKVLLFMKGTTSFPQCGFSDTATKILERLLNDNSNGGFHTVDVLSDNPIREGIKTYSQWPTIPQLYVDGEFIGGSDIMLELFDSGELAELINGKHE